MVIRAVVLEDHLAQDEAGNWRLQPTAFQTDELKQKKGKSASMFRETWTPPADLMPRAEAVTKTPAWKADPRLAAAQTQALRNLTTTTGRREVCVVADPIEDAFGFCPGHAFVRHVPPTPNEVLVWLDKKSRIAAAFTRIQRCSGSPI